MITTDKLFKPMAQPVLRPRDAKRLAPHLASSGKLNELLVFDIVATEDLQRMLLMEANRAGGSRYVIVRKLVARILSRERERLIRLAHGPVTLS